MDTKPPSDIESEAAELLRKIGWSEYDWKQVELYANMSPAQKIEQMFRLRRDVMELFEQRLRREHPESSDREI